MTLYLQPNRKAKYINILLGVIFIFQGLLNLLKEGFGFYFGIFEVLFGAIFFYFGFDSTKPTSKNASKITLDADQIAFKKDLFSKTRTILHEDIKLLQLKPEKLTVMTKEFGFSYSFPYEAPNKQEITDSIAQYAMDRCIPIERIPQSGT